MPQSQLTSEKLADILKDWSDNRGKISEVSRIAGSMAKLDATEAAAKVCMELADKAS